MPALNFQAQFRDVLRRRKRCTIRAPRKVPIRPGDTLYLFTGMRTRACELLRKDVCLSVEPIHLGIVWTNRRRDGSHSQRLFRRVMVRLGDNWLSGEELARLAREDGFDGVFDMIRFFDRTHGLPFSGHLIRW